MQKYERGAQGNVRGEQEQKWEIPFPKFRNGKGVKQIDSQISGTELRGFHSLELPLTPGKYASTCANSRPQPPFDPTKGTPVVRGLRTCVTWLSTHWALSAPSPRLSPPLRCTAFHCLQVRGRSPNRPSVEKKSQEIKLLQGSRGEKNHNMLKVAKSPFATETEKYSESLLVMLRLGKTVPTNIAVTSEKCSKSL